MANYKILFKGLRSGIDYTLTIGGESGTAVRLYGSPQPFTTDEDKDEDIFTPMRTQSGYIRIVDNGYSVPDGGSSVAVDWRDIIPVKDTERPVTLTHVEGGATVYDWVGFVQAQSFDGPMYERPAEREIPVQCVLQALDSFPVDPLNPGESSIVSFFGLIYKAFSHIPASMIGNFYIQGGNDAYLWLKSTFDWQNLFDDRQGSLEPKYSYKDALEDMCKFWGFTMRTSGRDIYLTQSGATDVLNKLTMTLAQIHTVATGGTAGTVTSGYYTPKTAGMAFASTEQDEIYLRGYNNAIVKVDCNQNDLGFEFAPEAVEKVLEENTTWQWIGEQGSQVGYFYTNPPKLFFMTDTLSGQAVSGNGQFARVQIFSDENDKEPMQADVVHILAEDNFGDTAYASLETTHEHRFGKGSIELNADIFKGYERKTYNRQSMRMAIGIGPSRDSEKTRWFKFDITINGIYDVGWTQAKHTFRVFPSNSRLCPGDISGLPLPKVYKFDKIPTVEGLEGKLFIDFFGSSSGEDWGMGAEFMIANFKLKFSRDEVNIPNSTSSGEPARVVSVKRQSSYEYKDAGWGKNQANWSADCIYASDNNMENGLGLLTDEHGHWLDTASYSQGLIRPESHLLNAVINFWKTKHSMKTIEMQYSSVGDVRPDHIVDGHYPVSINHDWYNDIIKIAMISQ